MEDAPVTNPWSLYQMKKGASGVDIAQTIRDPVDAQNIRSVPYIASNTDGTGDVTGGTCTCEAYRTSATADELSRSRAVRKDLSGSSAIHRQVDTVRSHLGITLSGKHGRMKAGESSMTKLACTKSEPALLWHPSG